MQRAARLLCRGSSSSPVSKHAPILQQTGPTRTAATGQKQDETHAHSSCIEYVEDAQIGKAYEFTDTHCIT